MRFIRSRFGLVLWCAIALLILIVPLWRLRATRQLQVSSVNIETSADFSEIKIDGSPDLFGLSASKSRTAARRFPNEIEAQLSSFDVDKLVEQVKAIQGSFQPYYNTPQQAAQTSARLLKTRPRVWQLTDNYFARYDVLERQYPASQLVRARHLSDLTRGDLGIDEGPPSLQADAAQREFFAGVLRTDPWISPRQRALAIASARAGAQLAPDNAFFPWMEALLQFASRRPLDALRALEIAGKCATFDDYSLQDVAARNALLKRLQTTGWEDDYTEFALARFPHFAKMRGSARAAVGQMRLARRRGDQKLAFRWAAATSRAAYAVARSDKNSLLGALVGTALCAVTLRGAIEDEPGAPAYPPSSNGMPPYQTDEQRKTTLQKYYDDNVAFFSQLARRKGDESLALETEKVAGHLDARELSKWNESSPRSMTARFQTLASAYWINAQLLKMALGCAALWCAFWFVTRRWDNIAPARKKMLPLAMFGAGVTGALVVGARSIAPALKSFLDLMSYQVEPPALSPPLAVLRDYWPLLIALLWVSLIFGGAVAQSARLAASHNQRETKSASGKWRVAGWALLGAVLLAALGYFVQIVPVMFDADWLLYVFLAVVAFVALALSFIGIQRTRGYARCFFLVMVAAFWLTVVMVILAFVVEQDSTLYGQIALASSLALIASALGLMLQSQNFLRELALRARIAAGVLALLCAVAYFGITLWALPVEHQTRAMMGRQLQIGEVAWLREQMREK